ncbi:MAG: sugar phosphate isomerase/epimerase [Gemmatimonadaceae bacterium]
MSGVTAVAAAWAESTACAPRAVVVGSPPPSADPSRLFPLDSVGLQLYTVRKLMAQGVEPTLEQVAAAGYRLVETAGLYDRKPEALRALFERYGLRTPSGHYPYALVQDKPDEVFATARALGQRYVVVPFLDANLRPSLDAYRALADRFNVMGEKARAAGLQFAYHNHSFEFETFGGTVPGFDVLLERTDPTLVTFELDLFWAYKADRDPLAYFERFPGRFQLAHAKDGTAAPAKTMTDVGQGAMPFARYFAAAERAGLRYAFVEHDEPQDPLASVRASRAYLKTILRGA